MFLETKKLLLVTCLLLLMFSSVAPALVGPGSHGTSGSKVKSSSDGNSAAAGGLARTPIIGQPGNVVSTLFVQNNTILPGQVVPAPVLYRYIKPIAVAYDPVNEFSYVANYAAGNITIINIKTGHLSGSIGGLVSPFDAIYDPSNGYVYVANANNVSVIDTSTNKIIKDINRGIVNGGGMRNRITTLAYDSGNQTVFVANTNSGNVSVISSSTDTVVNNFNFSSSTASPNGLAYDPLNNMIYVVDHANKNIYVVNATTYAYQYNISLPSASDGASIYYDPSSGTILIGSMQYTTLYAMDPSSGNAIKSISTAGQPYSMVYDPSNNTMIVESINASIAVLSSSNIITGNISETGGSLSIAFTGTATQELIIPEFSFGTISLINASTGSIAGVFSFQAFPSQSAYDRNTGDVYISDLYSNLIYVVNATTNLRVAKISMPGVVYSIIYDPGNRMIYASSDYMSAIDPTTFRVVSSLLLNSGPARDMTYDPSTGFIYTSNYYGSISEFDPATDGVIGNINLPIGSSPFGIVYDPADQLIYVGGYADNTIYIVHPSPFSMETELNVGSSYYPSVAAYNPLTQEVYFGSTATGTVVIVAGLYVVGSISSVGGDYGIIFNPSNNIMYFASGYTYNGNTALFAINAYTNQIMKQFGMHSPVGSMTYANSSETIYAPDLQGQGIFLFSNFIPPDHTVYFNQTGLPAGTTWYVNISTGTSISGNGNSLILEIPNGTFQYTVSTADKTYGAPSGTFTVSGKNITVNVAFSSTTYPVTFTESGIPSGYVWWANVTGQAPASSSGNTVTLNLVDGTYDYNLSSVNKTWKPVQESGTFSVDNSPVSLGASFGEVTYPVIFYAFNLPYGLTFYVNLSNGMKANSTNDITSLDLPNGTYHYTIGSSDKSYTHPGGTFTVAGTQGYEYIYFKLLVYQVKFSESGIPPSSEWYITAAGNNSGPLSPGSSFIQNLTNGTYTYSATCTNSSYLSNSGTFTVSGKSLNITVHFNTSYTVQFVETGLGTGIKWFVNLSDGQSLSGFGTSLSTNLPNGHYTYTVASADKIYAAGKGSLTVNNASVTKNIAFSLVTYKVTFSEKGLPQNTIWYLNLSNGTSYSSSSSAISSEFHNGTYSYTIATRDKTYHAKGGSFSVNGADSTHDVVFTLFNYSVSFSESGLPSGAVWYVNTTGHYSNQISSTSYLVNLPNGTYAFTISAKNKIYATSTPVLSLTVNGADLAESVIFSNITSEVTFTERGLSNGLKWFVNLSNGIHLSSTASTVNVYLENGTYQYNVSTVDKVFSARKGAFTVSGASLNEIIEFKPVNFTVTFSESGLKAGKKWSVTLNGVTRSSTSQTISFSEVNGSYTYRISNESGYYFFNDVGKLNVNGRALSVDATFYHFCYINGTINPANATIYVNGKVVNTVSGSFNLTVMNGSFSVIVKEKGYSPYYDNFSLTGGATKNLAISLKTSSPKSSGGSPFNPEYLIVAGVVVAIVIVGLALAIRRKK